MSVTASSAFLGVHSVPRSSFARPQTLGRFLQAHDESASC